MKSELTLIPKLTIHPSMIVSYNEAHWDPLKPSKSAKVPSIKREQQIDQYLVNSKRTAQGRVSDNARKKMRKAIEYLYLTAKKTRQLNPTTKKWFDFKASFVTLDLPSAQRHTDNEIKEICLNQFLVELRDYLMVKNYVWRAEKQQNGNIHFHIILDKFIHWSILQDRWNRITEKLGYVSEYRKNQLEFHKNGFTPRPELYTRWDKKKKCLVDNWTLEKQKAAYRKGMTENWSKPNSTDVHCLQYIKNVKSYFAKYIMKEVQLPDEPSEFATFEEKERYNLLLLKLLVQGRIWGCNKDLSNIKGCQLDVDSEISNELNSIIQKTNCKRIDEPYYSVFFIDSSQLKCKESPNLFNYFVQYLVKEFHYEYQTELFTPT